jgi:hypothetical protein
VSGNGPAGDHGEADDGHGEPDDELGEPGRDLGEPGADLGEPGRAQAERGDELPAELDVSGYVGRYVFPDNRRRRVPGLIYLAVAAGCLALRASRGEGVLVNRGFLVAAAGLAALGVYHLVAGVHLAVDETDALVAATRRVGFPVGHASAQLGWRGLISRPTWRILLYSAEDPPERRGMVLVDGVDGSIVGQYVERNPEDWSKLR